MSDRVLERALARNDVATVVSWFRGRSDKERREVAPMIAGFLEKHGVWSGKCGAAVVAGYAALTLGQIRKLHLSFPANPSTLTDVMVDRRPSWLASLVDRMLGDEFLAGDGFTFARELMNAGVLERPTSDDYLSAMAQVPMRYRWPHTTPLEVLLADEALIDAELWEMLADEGAIARLAASTTAKGSQWIDALTHLVATARMDRDRLLDTTLDGLERDFTAYQVRFFTVLHDALRPSIDELSARERRYVALLGHRLPTVVAFALGCVGILEKADRVNRAGVVEAVEPALLSETKRNAMGAIRLLDRCLRSEPELRERGVASAGVALSHPRLEVQEAALALLERHLDPNAAATRAELVVWAEAVSPAVAERFAALVGMQAEAPPAADVASRPLAQPSERAPVEPVANLGDAVALIARVLEDARQPMDVELALDALGAFGADLRGADGAHALVRRVEQLLDPGGVPFHGRGPQWDIGGVVLAAATGKVPPPPTAGAMTPAEWREADRHPLSRRPPSSTLPATMVGFFSLRAHEIARAVTKGWRGRLLSLPTDDRGWVAPSVAVQRVVATDGPLHFDAIQLLLRVGDEVGERAAALTQLPSSRNELAECLRHVLGAPDVRVGRTGAWWLAAARGRDPEGDDPAVARRHGKGVAGGAAAGRIRLTPHTETHWAYGKPMHCLVAAVSPVPSRRAAPVDEVVVGWTRSLAQWVPSYSWFQLSDHAQWSANVIRWAATAWPGGRTCYAALAALAIAHITDDDKSEWAAAWLERWLDPGEHLPLEAVIALGAAIGAKDLLIRTTAADVLITTIAEDRLDTDAFVRTVPWLLHEGVITQARIAAPLADVGRISAAHASVVIEAVEATWRGQAGRDAHALLEVAVELRARHGRPVREGAARSWLEQFSGSTKAAKLAKKLLALS